MSDVGDRSRLLAAATATSAEAIWCFKDIREAITPVVATDLSGVINSLWHMAGQPGAATALPGGTARNPTNATAGSVQQTDPAAGTTKWLIDMWFGCGNNSGGVSQVILYDRLADISGLNGTTTSAQNTTSLAVTRYTGAAAAGNAILVEVYTLIGATPQNITASYTNQAGTAGQTTIAVQIGGGAGRAITSAVILPLAQGDTGVRSVESVTLAGSTGTAGNFGVTIIRPLATLIVTESSGTIGLADEPTMKGPVEIKNGACLAFYSLGNSAAQVPYDIGMKFVEL